MCVLDVNVLFHLIFPWTWHRCMYIRTIPSVTNFLNKRFNSIVLSKHVA